MSIFDIGLLLLLFGVIFKLLQIFIGTSKEDDKTIASIESYLDCVSRSKTITVLACNSCNASYTHFPTKSGDMLGDKLLKYNDNEIHYVCSRCGTEYKEEEDNEFYKHFKERF